MAASGSRATSASDARASVTLAVMPKATESSASRIVKRAAYVRLAAILNRGSGPLVYVVDESGALVQRPVKVASFTHDSALVASGIHDGDKVVTLGVQKLEAGLKVRTIE